MITFKSFLKEEVFNWYIVKGTSSKGKVSHVGTERQLKLKIRKPTFPKGHILLKSRKDLKIGDVWKGSMGVSEEVKIDEGAGYFDIDSVDKWMKEIGKGIVAPFVEVSKSTLGGADKVSITIKLSLDSKEDWINNIFHNSRYAMFDLDRDGSFQLFSRGLKLRPNKMRKSKVKSAKDVVNKVNTWIKGIK